MTNNFLRLVYGKPVGRLSSASLNFANKRGPYGLIHMEATHATVHVCLHYNFVTGSDHFLKSVKSRIHQNCECFIANKYLRRGIANVFSRTVPEEQIHENFLPRMIPNIRYIGMIISCSCVTILKNSHGTIIMGFIITVSQYYRNITQP